METAYDSPSLVERLFRPLRIGHLDLPSRIVMAPMSRYFCLNGTPSEAVADYYARRAANGVGLVITEGTYIGHPTAASYEGVPFFAGEALLGWERVRAAVHAAGGRIFPQLWHTGSFRQSSMGPQPGVSGIGPSENRNVFTGHPESTRAMTTQDIDEVIEAYAQAASAAQRLGFDGVEIHAAHGYLIDEFLWETTNRRTDRYGGNRRQRTRFATEIIRAIRGKVGAEFPISFRYSQWKQQDYSARLAQNSSELAEVLEPIANAGVNLFHCSTRRVWEPGFPAENDMTMAGWTKHITGLPVIAVGSVGLDRPGLREAQAAPLDRELEPFERGEFDLLAVGRALLADPKWAAKLREGRMSEGVGYSKELLNSLY